MTKTIGDVRDELAASFTENNTGVRVCDHKQPLSRAYDAWVRTTSVEPAEPRRYTATFSVIIYLGREDHYASSLVDAHAVTWCRVAETVGTVSDGHTERDSGKGGYYWVITLLATVSS